jgi:hypothetical protein
MQRREIDLAGTVVADQEKELLLPASALGAPKRYLLQYLPTLFTNVERRRALTVRPSRLSS